jgi:Zn-dependent peptidase ImmA (M78 family)/DNA-binding XRE family transcriptional regulator
MKHEKGRAFQGRRLRLARLFQGLTLAELGESVAASRQYMQRLENESVSPSQLMVDALVETLKTEPSFFFEPLASEVYAEECHFRKLRTTPQHIRDRALAYGTIFTSLVSYFEKELRLPTINIAPIKVHSREDIERAAEECRRRWKLRLDAPIDNMSRTLESVGCVVTVFDGVSDKIDAFSFYRDRPVIVRNIAKNSTSRARFDLAHECGHLVMHRDFEVGDPALEEQANQFASAFLLPRGAFLREFKTGIRLNWNELFLMKKRWGVSIDALVRRAYDLQLLSAVQYRSANIYISRNWRSHGEPPETEPAPESMDIIPDAFELLGQIKGITPSDVASRLGLKCSYLEKFHINCKLTKESTEQSENCNVVFLSDYRQNKSNVH